jgi:Ca-activated chloride channel family protein
MIVLNPDYLIFMLIPTIILFYLILTQRSNISSVFDKRSLEKLTFDNGSLGKMGRNILLLASLIFMIFALSRPVLEKGNVKITGKKIDLLVALDISKSMLATDIYPNRLAFAKKKLYEFIDSFNEANIGVVAFSSEGFLVSPMTQDSTTLKYLIENLSLESISSNGTDLLIPIQKGESFLKDSKQKIVIIFTDGGDNTEFSEELQAAKDANVHVYVYATATNRGSPIKNDNGESIKDKDGNIVITKLNSDIKTLAIESGGAYIVGGLKDDSVMKLVEDIKRKFEMSDSKHREIKDYKELFYYPLGIALFLMFLAFSSTPRRNVSAILLMLLIYPTESLKADMFDFQTINKAEKAYKNKNYKKATKAYEDVMQSKKNSQSFYDLANSLYKEKKYKQALNYYDKVTTEDKNLEYKKEFNTGNSHFQMKKYEEALKSYERAQKIKSENDLKHNIELTKKMIQKQKQKKKKDDKKDKNNNKNDNKQKQDQQKKDKDKKKNKQKNQNSKEGDKDKEQGKKSEKQQESKEKKISEKEAKKWADRLEKMKPKTMPMRFQSQKLERRKNEKPW